MKTHKTLARIGALALAASMSLTSLAACTKDDADAPEKEKSEKSQKKDKKEAELTDEEIIEKIIEANKGIHPSVADGKMSMTLGMKDLIGEDMSMDISYNVELLSDPDRLHMTMTSDMGELGTEEAETYGEKDADGNYILYTNDGTGWTKTQEENINDALNSTGAMVDLDQLRDIVGEENFALERDSDSYTLTIDIPGDKAKSLMGDMVDEMNMGDMLEDFSIDKYHVVATYDAETFYSTSVELDVEFSMTIMGETIPVTMKMTGDIDNDPSGLEIEIPAEAKEA